MADVFIHDEKSTACTRSQLGQFMTPKHIAAFMAEMVRGRYPPRVRLLDAGAGRGALSDAFAARWQADADGTLDIQAYELDDALAQELEQAFLSIRDDGRITTHVTHGDFIESAATMLRLDRGPRFTHAILNPPYKKMNAKSRHRALLRTVGLETVNLYTGFVGLALDLLEHGGHLVAIIPRSFCNGPYYRPFRTFVLRRAALRQIHLFTARDRAFRQDAVLQENVIIWLERHGLQGDVTISTSSDDTFRDHGERVYRFDEIVLEGDREQFIHVPTEAMRPEFHCSGNLQCSLADVGIHVSTGPVVDFRLRQWLRQTPGPGCVPLFYPAHFTQSGVCWPRYSMKKANAIQQTAETTKWLYPRGFYTVTRRFSSKEERRRIVANVVDPEGVPGELFGFENHLNVFHHDKQPLPENVARGLAAYLNSTAVDQYFRRFNGHTQVNATDLRLMRYPSRAALAQLGNWAKSQMMLSQEIIDQAVRAIA